MIPWRNPCCCPPPGDFLYKRFPAGFGSITPHDVILPPDDVTWTPSGPLPYTNLSVASNGVYHLAGRVYSGSGGTLSYAISPETPTHGSPLNPPPEYTVVDAAGRLYYYRTRGAGTLERHYDLYRYDHSTATHSLVASAPWAVLPNDEFGNERRIVGPLDRDVRVTDTRGNHLLVAGVDYSDRVTLFDVSSGAVVWHRRLSEIENAVVPLYIEQEWLDIPRLFFARLGADGAVYVSGTQVARVSHNFSPALDVPYSFWKLDLATGNFAGGYGRFQGYHQATEVDMNHYNMAIRTSFSDKFDVDVSGNVVIAVNAVMGRAIVRLTPGGSTRDGDTDPYAYVSNGYSEGWLVHDGLTRPNPYEGTSGFIPFSWPCHDTVGGAYWIDYKEECIRHTNGVVLVDWAKRWGLHVPTASYRTPQIMVRQDDGRIHTATKGELLRNDTATPCEAVPQRPTVNTACCNDIPATLNGTLSMSEIPMSHSPLVLTWDGTSQWIGTTTVSFPGSGCIPENVELTIKIECIFDPGPPPSANYWRITVIGSLTQTFAEASFNCDPFELVVGIPREGATDCADLTLTVTE